MKRLFFTLILMCAVLSYPLAGANNVNNNNKETAAMPKVGDLAPDFKLQYLDEHGLKDVTLDQYRGKKQVVLAFYIFAFTGG
jgi:hypothetical protein